MKKRWIIFSWVFFISCAGTQAHQQPAPAPAPVVFALDAKTLADAKSRIKAGDAVALSAYKQLIKDAAKSLQFGPVSVMEKKDIPPSGDKHDYMSLAPYHWPDPSKADGLPYIRKDGQTNPEVKEYKDKEYMPRLCEEVFTLALAWYFSEDKSYAEHATQLLKVWFLDTATRMNPNLNYAQAIKGVNTGRGAGMIDSRHFVKLIDAIGLLGGSKAWKREYQQGMQNWFARFLEWMQTSKNGIDEMNAANNHGAWYDAQRLSMALFTGNTELAKKTVLNAQNRLDKQMDDKGGFPLEMERTISLHYTVFVTDAFYTIAQMAEQTGIDFWGYTSPSGKSLKKGFDALYPYIGQQKEWYGQQIKPFNYEEGYFILVKANEKLGCKKCRQDIKDMAGDKAGRLRLQLIY